MERYREGHDDKDGGHESDSVICWYSLLCLKPWFYNNYDHHVDINYILHYMTKKVCSKM